MGLTYYCFRRDGCVRRPSPEGAVGRERPAEEALGRADARQCDSEGCHLKMVTPDAKRKAVARACEVHGVSQRRACQALNIDRSTVRYTSIHPDDGPLREAMKAVAAERRRFGYRRIHIMLERQGIVMNQKKLRRLYREEKLQVRRRGGRKRRSSSNQPGMSSAARSARRRFSWIFTRRRVHRLDCRCRSRPLPSACPGWSLPKHAA